MTDEEFYVGYLPEAPPRTGRYIRRALYILGSTALCVCLLMVLSQKRETPKTFEYGRVRTFEGKLASDPYPTLLPSAGGAPYLLVAPGKRAAELPNLVGKSVKVRGSLIAFGNERMIEVLPGVDVLPDIASPHAERTQSQRVTLSGEIVDTKCFFGVMQPGSSKIHRDCAARCISGGIPPGLLVRDSAGQLHTILLARSDNRPLREELLPWVAEPVSVTGLLVSTAFGPLLRTEPRDIIRRH